MDILRPKETIEYNGLIDLCNYVNNINKEIKTFVEIGSFTGESTEVFRNKFIEAKIYIIDIWDKTDETEEIFKTDYNLVEKKFNERMLSYRNYGKIKMKSEEVVDLFKDDFIDMIYIDGDHRYDYVINDIKLWLPKIKKGGIIAGHDYYTEDYIKKSYWTNKWDMNFMKDVKKAVIDIIGIPDKLFVDSSWLKIKI